MITAAEALKTTIDVITSESDFINDHLNEVCNIVSNEIARHARWGKTDYSITWASIYNKLDITGMNEYIVPDAMADCVMDRLRKAGYNVEGDKRSAEVKWDMKCEISPHDIRMLDTSYEDAWVDDKDEFVKYLIKRVLIIYHKSYPQRQTQITFVHRKATKMIMFGPDSDNEVYKLHEKAADHIKKLGYAVVIKHNTADREILWHIGK